MSGSGPAASLLRCCAVAGCRRHDAGPIGATGLPDQIRAYIDASREQEAAEHAQTERRRRRTLVGLAGGLGAALLLAAFAATQWSRATAERRIADAQTRIAVARQLAAQSQLLAEAAQSELVQRALLVAESLRRLPTLQAFLAWNELQATMPRLEATWRTKTRRSPSRGARTAPSSRRAMSPVSRSCGNRGRASSGYASSTRRPWEGSRSVLTAPCLRPSNRWRSALVGPETGVERARLVQIDGEPLVMFSPDGTRLATAAWTAESGPEAEHVFHLWNTATGDLTASLVHPGDSDWRPRASARMGSGWRRPAPTKPCACGTSRRAPR